MAQFVIDACVATKWFIREELAEIAFDLVENNNELLAPDFVLLEIANALWKSERRGIIPADYANSSLRNAPKYFDQLLPTFALLEEALALAREIGQPVYDCTYVVASRRMSCRMITADTKLVAKLAGTPDAPNVVHLADWK